LLSLRTSFEAPFLFHVSVTFSCALRRNSASFRNTSFGAAIEASPPPCRLKETARARSGLLLLSRMLLLDLSLLCLPPRVLPGAARRVSGEIIGAVEVYLSKQRERG
jgi:hypothetical protein